MFLVGGFVIGMAALPMVVGFSEVGCEMVGGDWVVIQATIGEPLYGCGFMRLGDYGRECWKSEECLGNCVIFVYSDLDGPPGQCESDRFYWSPYLWKKQGYRIEEFYYWEQ